MVLMSMSCCWDWFCNFSQAFFNVHFDVLISPNTVDSENTLSALQGNCSLEDLDLGQKDVTNVCDK